VSSSRPNWPPAGAIIVAMVPVTRLFADHDGRARFEDIEIPLAPDDPPLDAVYWEPLVAEGN
jgi:hypothetical protein